ncbi:MAG TPA: metallophosphoesterase [Solirubrobacterales bacterium]|nr:metallophosphoesterase [Solirubrobacterales bacterium]
MTDTRPLRPVNELPFGPVDGPGEFTFAVAGDGRPTVSGMPFPQVTADIMREVGLLRPAFTLYTGDAIFGYHASRQQMLNELDRFRSLANTSRVPLFNVPGNHEAQSSAAAMEVLAEWGHDLYGSFDFHGWHFVGLNTDEPNREGRVTGDQLAWLEQDLLAATGAQGTFVFMHRPLFSWFQGDFNPDDAQLLMKLFAAHGVKAVFAAHDHFYYEEEHDGVRYITVGGAGGPFYTQPPAGGFSHYMLVSCGPRGAELSVVQPNRLEVAVLAGDDGLEPVTTARLANITDRDVLARGLRLRVPRLADPSLYRVSAKSRDFALVETALDAAITHDEDLGDGSVALTVRVPLPTGCAVWVTVEAHEPD